MKTQNKKKIKNLLCILGLSTIVGLSACSSHYDYEYKDNDYQYEEKLYHKNIAYDESTYTITYDSDDLDDYDTMYNIYSILLENDYIDSTSLSITGTINSADNLNSVKAYASPVGVVFFATSMNYFCVLSNNSVAWYNYSSQQVVEVSSLSIVSETYYNLFAPAEDNVPQVLNDFVSILVGGISSLASGIASGVSAMASALFLNVNSSTGVVEGLSLFGGIIAIFAGLALAIAITTRVYLWITRLGK